MRKVLLIILFTCGCAHIDENIKQARMKDALLRAELNKQKCLTFGFKDGTESMANCALQLESARLSRPVINNSIQQAPTQPSQPFHCTTMNMGSGMSSTNCN